MERGTPEGQLANHGLSNEDSPRIDAVSCGDLKRVPRAARVRNDYPGSILSRLDAVAPANPPRSEGRRGDPVDRESSPKLPPPFDDRGAHGPRPEPREGRSRRRGRRD